MFKRAMLLAACAGLGACTSVVEDRVETGLTEAGIPAGMAVCMSEIWARDLSVSQIRRIADFARTVRAERQTLTAGRLLQHVGEWNDPQALGVVTASAARCAFS